MIKKVIVPILLGILVSFFFYPVGFTFLPYTLNTKMILGVIGVLLFVYNSIRGKGMIVHWDVAKAGLIAIVFSVACFVSVTANNTEDTSYSSYILSFLVWTFSAYSVCHFLRLRYGKVDLWLIARYLTIVAVAQCVIAQLIDMFLPVKLIVDSIFSQGQEFMVEVDRLYGIGASLDNAGVRFTVTLLLLSYFIIEFGKSGEHRTALRLSYLAFIFITVFGNMISRTTSVGVLLGLCYMGVYFLQNISVTVRVSQLRSIAIVILLLTVAIPLFSWLYATNPDIRENLRFAFEGFFNWKETGVWRTDSTDKLNAVMWIWPTDTKTWIIGSGLFDGWVYGTDIGYCRFILYCGLLGFSLFSGFFVFNAWAFYRKFPDTGVLALLLLATTFIVWMKVATDIYLLYALLYNADDPERIQV